MLNFECSRVLLRLRLITAGWTAAFVNVRFSRGLPNPIEIFEFDTMPRFEPRAYNLVTEFHLFLVGDICQFF